MRAGPIGTRERNRDMATMSEDEFERENMFGTGAPNDGFARYFVGQSYT